MRPTRSRRRGRPGAGRFVRTAGEVAGCRRAVDWREDVEERAEVLAGRADFPAGRALLPPLGGFFRDVAAALLRA
ncbi:MAG: hypothetical protein Q4B12_03470 [Bowdeniella nasicola]|nr:hypothetical protein [Bowdeniella nasicola]